MPTDQDHRLKTGPHAAATRRPRRVVLVAALALLLLAVAWTGLWLHAASVAQSTIADWQAREERNGRSFRCGTQQVGGYPFRIQMQCSDAVAELPDAPAPLELKVREVLAAVRVYQPTLVTAELSAPVTAGERGSSAAVAAEWTLAQASVQGLPASPERISTAIDNLRMSHPADAAAAVLFGAHHLELDARLDPASRPDHPVVDLIARLQQATAPVAGPPFDEPIDFEIAAVLQGLEDLEPKPIAEVLRAFQRRGGVLQLVRARVAQRGMVTTGIGTLGLSPNGRLDGVVDLTISGFDWGVLERLVPSLKGGSTSLLGAGVLALLGKPAELEGRPAVTVPLRFKDGAVALGPIPLGAIGSLY